MATYNVTYSCGHEGELQLYGPHKERERKLDYFRKHGLCKACWAAQQAKEGPEIKVLAGATKVMFEARNSYSVREQLKARKWSYDGYDKLWRKDCKDEQSAVEEYRWLKEQGWKINCPQEGVKEALEKAIA